MSEDFARGPFLKGDQVLPFVEIFCAREEQTSGSLELPSHFQLSLQFYPEIKGQK